MLILMLKTVVLLNILVESPKKFWIFFDECKVMQYIIIHKSKQNNYIANVKCTAMQEKKECNKRLK